MEGWDFFCGGDPDVPPLYHTQYATAQHVTNYFESVNSNLAVLCHAG